MCISVNVWNKDQFLPSELKSNPEQERFRPIRGEKGETEKRGYYGDGAWQRTGIKARNSFDGELLSFKYRDAKTFFFS